MQVLTILFALVAPIIASIKHEGKDHRHPRQQQQRRQPVGGLGMLATPSSASAATATPTPTPIPSMASSVTEAVPTISSYLFPTTVIQVPVATVCPDTPASEAMFPILPVSSLASMAVSNATRGSNSSGNNDTVTSYVPVQVNATALLPNGSTIVFLSVSSTALLVPTSRPLPSAPGASPEINNTSADNDDAARIVLDANGCQTVFSAITTRLCSTTLSPAGMIPVPVTDCDQWVTFSSQQRLDDSCSTPAPAGPSASEATAPKVTPTPAKYYLAHWYDLAQNAVPNIVRMLDCPSTAPAVNSSDDSIAGCVTSSESWYVTSSTTTSTGSTVASFSGVSLLLHFSFLSFPFPFLSFRSIPRHSGTNNPSLKIARHYHSRVVHSDDNTILRINADHDNGRHVVRDCQVSIGWRSE